MATQGLQIAEHKIEADCPCDRGKRKIVPRQLQGRKTEDGPDAECEEQTDQKLTDIAQRVMTEANEALEGEEDEEELDEDGDEEDAVEGAVEEHGRESSLSTALPWCRDEKSLVFFLAGSTRLQGEWRSQRPRRLSLSATSFSRARSRRPTSRSWRARFGKSV